MSVSIITVCFNSEKTIRDTIESVLSQSYKEIEYIVIDGGSTDSTLAILEGYREKISHLVSERDEGIYDAMNKGIALAQGDVVGMLNSDDVYFDENTVGIMMHKLSSTGSDCVFADLLVVDRDNLKRVRRYYDSSRFTPKKFRYGWMPAHPTFFVKKSIYNLVGNFSLDYKIASDYEMLVRLLWVKKISYAYLKKPIVRMRQGGASSSGLSRNWILNREIVMACKAHGINTSLFLLTLKIPGKLLEVVRPLIGRLLC